AYRCNPNHACGTTGLSGLTFDHPVATANAHGAAAFHVTSTQAQPIRFNAQVPASTGGGPQQGPALDGSARVTFTSGLSGAVKPGGKGWAATAAAFEGKVGQRYTYLCPAGGTRDTVWGTATYTDDSSVCTAAVNAGVITVAAGGTVTIEIRPGTHAYVGSSRNGTTTQAYGSFSGSFVVVGSPTHRSSVGFGGGDWSADASGLRGQNGHRFLYSCPSKGSFGSVYGTATYTDDSSVCTAAVHAGLITVASGGDVTIEIRPGAASYSGSSAHGVTSNDWDSFEGSFVFVGG
ncbi:MAG TPA: LCCL domain-containing protein, partial [Gaiellaceae bacterium]|nr:LCCL domain-containing protein [Gaiellaceae bacterium]